MATRLSTETLKNLSDFLSHLAEFKRNPLDLTYELEKSEVTRSKEDFSAILKDFEKRVEKKKKDAEHFSIVIRHYNSKVIPITEESKNKVADAVLAFAKSLDHALACMQYHLESGLFPPGMTSLKDCYNLVKGINIISQYYEVVSESLREAQLTGKPKLTKHLKDLVDEEEDTKQKKEDLWSYKGKDLRTQIRHKVQTDPKLKKFDIDDNDVFEEEKEDEEQKQEVKKPEKGYKGLEKLYSSLAKMSSRYNQLLGPDAPQWIIPGSIVSSSFVIGKDTKVAAKTKKPKVYIKEAPDKEFRSEGYLFIRNIPILGIAAKTKPDQRKIAATLAELQDIRGKKYYTFLRIWAKYWDVASVPKMAKGHYYFVLWPRKHRGGRKTLFLREWDFNSQQTGKPFSEIEIERV